jgi:membrane protease YdiL (CAAX protease family)
VTITDVQHGAALSVMEILIAITLLTGGFQASLESVGLRLSGLRRQVNEGTLAFLASFGPVFLVLLATYWLRTDENQHPYLKLLREDPSPVTFAWLVLTAVVITPVREELLFRVMLQDGLARRIGAAPAIGIVAVLFCYVHGFPDSLALFPLALILGYVYHQRQSAVAVIVAHALFNLANIAILLLGGPD